MYVNKYAHVCTLGRVLLFGLRKKDMPVLQRKRLTERESGSCRRATLGKGSTLNRPTAGLGPSALLVAPDCSLNAVFLSLYCRYSYYYHHCFCHYHYYDDDDYDDDDDDDAEEEDIIVCGCYRSYSDGAVIIDRITVVATVTIILFVMLLLPVLLLLLLLSF